MNVSIEALERLPGYWLGRASTRRALAEQLRAEGNTRAADECLVVASEYEARAGVGACASREKQG